MHGFALNVNVDLKYFEKIIPCGIKNNSVTSLSVELGIKNIDINEVKNKILKNFKILFDATLID
jgi:lipoyl(octanoyl) transferase